MLRNIFKLQFNPDHIFTPEEQDEVLELLEWNTEYFSEQKDNDDE